MPLELRLPPAPVLIARADVGVLLVTSSYGWRREGIAVVPYFALTSKLHVPPCLQQKKLAATKPVVLFTLPPPSLNLPIKAVIEFHNAPDMVNVGNC
jgi:hypothetical protein